MGIVSHSIGPVKELGGAYFHQECFLCENKKCGKKLPYNQSDHPLYFDQGKVWHQHCVPHDHLKPSQPHLSK